MTKSTFTLSQELVIESPEPSRGLPVTHHEWATLKTKIECFRKRKSFVDSCGWKDIGMVFLGVALATFVSLWLPGYSSSYAKIAWAVICISLLFWLSFIFFQYQLDKKDSEKNKITADGILEIMDLIEINRATFNKKLREEK
jgi:hypothetical protein